MSYKCVSPVGLMIAAWLVVASASAAAQPVITNASGSWGQKGTVTIQGSGFGTKPSAAPVVWDDASATNILTKWDGGWPTSEASAYMVRYTAPIRGIAPPHNRVGRYLAGAHGGTSATTGWNVMVWKNRSITYPAYTYASWYQRSDPAWVFLDGNTADTDNNFKIFAWSMGNEPYMQAGSYCYVEHNPRFQSLNGTGAWAGTCFGWGSTATNLFTQWTKIEMEMKWTNQSDGYIKVWDNGRLVVDARNIATDTFGGNARNDAIGGFARAAGQSNNWRYFADLYLDYSRARVILGNTPTLANSTIREVQIPSAWSSSSITISANLGKFADGQTAYLFVVDPNGVANATGFPVTLLRAPGSPMNVRILR